VKIGALTATLMGINDLSSPSGPSWPRANFTFQCILLVYIFEGINKILLLFAKYDIKFWKKEKKGTEVVHKSLLNECMLHENGWSDSHNILGDIYL
jgi:hypothetical protein